jgi:hypothetical protein
MEAKIKVNSNSSKKFNNHLHKMKMDSLNLKNNQISKMMVQACVKDSAKQLL